jgi:hypothetical protein
MKRVLVASVLLLAVSAASALAQDRHQKRLESILKRMDPATRLEQVCDVEAMKRINRDHRRFKIDRSVVSALAEPKGKGRHADRQGRCVPLQGQVVSVFFHLPGSAGPSSRTLLRI